MLIDKSVAEFLDETASKNPVPGGGSIAAQSGATSAALIEMVANLTIGKKKYEVVNEEMQEIIKKASKYRQELLKYIDLDSQAFNKVMKAYKMSKDTQEEKSLRKTAIEDSLKYAASIPLEVANISYSLMSLSEKVIKNGNENAVTDGAVSVMMARTSVLSALYNVKINLQSISDNNFINKLTIEVEDIEDKTIKLEKEILQNIDI
ncbi:MAG: cyclodeaminase/cyclohydrolase family protein [Vallitalea sp.]|jgi:formiminotetrahydrofolate cyclodeaminase|nr:cyclodeaminase/cyclohydrolase family protein [Vallitalea sp.]